MFEKWRTAWRQAVENFHREVGEGQPAAGLAGLAAAMRRDLAAARDAAARLEADLAAARRELAEEREAEASCRRREALARGIADEETARLAADFALRHAERAAVLDRKADALAAELALRRRDIGEMEAAMVEAGVDPAASTPQDPLAEDDGSFDRLRHEAREREAERRLDELKRRMR